MAARKKPAREAAPPLGFRRRLLAAAGEMATPRRRRLWKWLLAELAIVFLGVSLASWAEDYRQHRSDEALSGQILAALGRSLVDLEKHEDTVGKGLDAELARFDAQRKQGLRPVPPVYRESMAERPPTLVWGALVETGGARLLPPDLLFDFARFFNRMDSLGERYIRYNQFSEERFLPVVDKGGVVFYDSGGALKPEFREHVARLREIRGMQKQMVVDGARLRAAIAAVTNFRAKNSPRRSVEIGSLSATQAMNLAISGEREEHRPKRNRARSARWSGSGGWPGGRSGGPKRVAAPRLFGTT